MSDNRTDNASSETGCPRPTLETHDVTQVIRRVHTVTADLHTTVGELRSLLERIPPRAVLSEITDNEAEHVLNRRFEIEFDEDRAD